MSSSQDVPQSPVTLIAPARSPPEDCNGAASLCESCRKAHYAALRDDDEDWTLRGNHVFHRYTGPTTARKLHMDEWPNLPRLLNSAHGGCGFCALLRESILSDKFNDAWKRVTQGSVAGSYPKRLGLELLYGSSRLSLSDPYHLGFLFVRVTFEEGVVVCLRFQVEASSSKQPGLYLVVHRFTNVEFVVTDCKAVAEWLSLDPPAIKNYDDDEIVSFLKEGMQNCPDGVETDHGNANFLPDRLIDVGVNSLRLVERKAIIGGPAKRPSYCALSYCWGPSEDARSQTKTTRKNLKHHLQNLDFDALSPVLKDAVKTARSLSIRYLWVDALCILQDDVSDWQKQCSQMNDIYGRACVTLIAASSRTCREGFLNPKRPGVQIPYQSVRRPDISGSFMLRFTHAVGEPDVLFSFITPGLINDLYSDFKFTQWACRGWTFQEDALAGARIVYGNVGVYLGRDNEYVSQKGHAGSVAAKFVTSFQSEEQLHGTWGSVISRYAAFTTSSFTNPTDVLPALSGLARLFGNRLQVKYIAGHWVDKLHLSLHWKYPENAVYRSLDDIEERHGGKPYLVPTWSCLTRGEIMQKRSYTSGLFQSEITVCEVYMPLVGTDPYGAIQDCCLTLEGFVLDLGSFSWSESPERLVGSRDSHAEKIWFTNYASKDAPYDKIFMSFSDTPEKEKRSRYAFNLDFQTGLEYRSFLGTAGKPFEQLISQATLLLVGAREATFFNDRFSMGYGLVLIPNERASERSFLRIGIFEDYTSESAPCCLKRLMKKERIKIS